MRIHTVALRLLDLTPQDRSDALERMFVRRRRDLVSYWLQLLLSVAIATVGLVLGSTAVVIGAMLIAPLMGPIVELGMGLVAGSPVLTLRSLGRMAGSVLARIAGAALLTMLLPIHEITAEISTRTSPTALDLLLAVFVAVAAAFTTARPGSETTSAAAGTAIGIALVPPVCVIGFGLGVGDVHVARGATSSLSPNLTAILFVSVLFFWTLAFETLDTTAWEDEALVQARPEGWTRRAVRGLRARGSGGADVSGRPGGGGGPHGARTGQPHRGRHGYCAHRADRLRAGQRGHAPSGRNPGQGCRRGADGGPGHATCPGWRRVDRFVARAAIGAAARVAAGGA